MPTNAQLGHAIRRQRHARSLTIEALAFAADVHPTYLSGIERGLRNPTWAKLCGLAQALDLTVAMLARAAELETLVALADVLEIDQTALMQGASDLDTSDVRAVVSQRLGAGRQIQAPTSRSDRRTPPANAPLTRAGS